MLRSGHVRRYGMSCGVVTAEDQRMTAAVSQLYGVPRAPCAAETDSHADRSGAWLLNSSSRAVAVSAGFRTGK